MIGSGHGLNRGPREHQRSLQERLSIMSDKTNQASGITNAPLEKEQDEQAKVPASDESIIGKSQNRKPSSRCADACFAWKRPKDCLDESSPHELVNQESVSRIY